MNYRKVLSLLSVKEQTTKFRLGFLVTEGDLEDYFEPNDVLLYVALDHSS